MNKTNPLGDVLRKQTEQISDHQSAPRPAAPRSSAEPTRPTRTARGSGPTWAERNKPHTMVLPVELIERIDRAVQRTGMSKAQLAIAAWRAYLDDHGL